MSAPRREDGAVTAPLRRPAGPVLRRATALTAGLLGLAFCLSTAAGAATVREFPLAGSTAPNDLSAGPGGALWVTVDGAFARVDPVTGSVARITQGLSPGAQPYAVAPTPDGGLLFTENDEETGDGDGVIGRISALGVVRERPDESLDRPAALRDVVARPDGTAVFVDNADAGLGVFSEDADGPSYDLTPFDADGNTDPTAVALTPDGSAWYTGTQSPGVIGRATFGPRRDDFPATYDAEHAIPPGDGAFDDGAPEDIVAGPDGGVWFTLPFASAVGRIDVATKEITIVRTAAGGSPTGITVGPDGAIWFTDAGTTPSVGRIDPATRQVVQRGDGISSPDARPRRIAVGPDGALWFTEPGSDAVGRVDPASFAPPAPPEPEPPAAPASPAEPAPPAVAPTPAPTPAPVSDPPAAAPPAPAPVPVDPVDSEPAMLRVTRISHGVRVRAPRRARLRFVLSRPADVRVTITGPAAPRTVPVAQRTVRARAGTNRLMLPRLRAGLHVVTLRATTPDGARATVRTRVRVLPARRAAPAFTG